MSEEEKISSAVAFTVITELRDQLKIKDMRIQKLKQKIEKYKDLLEECEEAITGSFEGFIDVIAGGENADLIQRINEVLHDE